MDAHLSCTFYMKFHFLEIEFLEKPLWAIVVFQSKVRWRMLETQCVGDILKMLVKSYAILVDNIRYLFT